MIVSLLSGTEIDTKQENWCESLTEQLIGWRLKYSEKVDYDSSLKNEIANIADQVKDSGPEELRIVITGMILSLIKNKLDSINK